MTPIPPSLASAIAIEDSVTVSMAAPTSGIFRGMFLENLLWISDSFGSMSEGAGIRRISSNVRASGASSFSLNIVSAPSLPDGQQGVPGYL